MKVLISGSAGFVGRHFAHHYSDAGADVVGVDLVDGNDCRDLFRTCEDRFDLVIHCAATIGGRKGIDGSPLAVAQNLSLDAEMWHWAVRTRQPRVVYFSSSAAYPVDLQDGIHSPRLHEDDIRLGRTANPDATYGLAKMVGEQLARHASDAGVAVHVLRPFSGYGSDQSLDYPFPSFIARAREREDPFTVWGSGKQVRDWIHVDDIVAGTLAVIDADERRPVNLGTGRPVAFDDLARMACNAAGYAPKIAHVCDAPSGVMYRCADPSRMLGIYTPKVTLEEGIRRALCA